MASGGKRSGAGRPKGGKREGAGRPKGAICKSTRAILEAAEKGGITPLQYMLKVMRNPKAATDRRDDMAKAAASFMHPRLSSIEQFVDAEVRQHVVSGEPISEDDWEKQYGDQTQGGVGAATGTAKGPR